MTLAELQTKANAKLADFWTLLQTKQEVFFLKHGRYFQLITSPPNEVIDGADSAFSLTHPSDESFTVDVDFPWADLIPFQIEVSPYQGPTGSGYTAIATVKLPNGKVYRRSRTYNDPRITKWNYSEDEFGTKTKTGDPYFELSAPDAVPSTDDTNWYQVILET